MFCITKCNNDGTYGNGQGAFIGESTRKLQGRFRVSQGVLEAIGRSQMGFRVSEEASREPQGHSAGGVRDV